MPSDDVSDLRDVVDAINRLCDTMKTSHYDEVSEDTLDDDPAAVDEVNFVPVEIVDATAIVSPEVSIRRPSDVESTVSFDPAEVLDAASIVSPEEISIRTVDPSELWSDSLMSLPLETIMSDSEPVALCEPASEMYYTASSEVSLLSDTEVPERVTVEESLEDKECKDERKEGVMAGHVAAMRERFESMTRTNTPCPELMRSSSPSLDVFRNITPSPDRLG